MKQFDIKEYNKMCAEFMGLTVIPAGTKTMEQIHLPEVSEAFLNYDVDWNSIMDVVEKINNPTSGIMVSIHPNACLITDVGVRGEVSLNAMKNIVRVVDASSRKDAVVQAIWEFLNWYQEQSKPQTT